VPRDYRVLLQEAAARREIIRTFFCRGKRKISRMQKGLGSLLPLLSALAMAAAPLAVHAAGSTNASAKVTLQTSYMNVLGPITASTGTTSNISSGWQTVLQQDIKMANDHDLLINAGFEVGLLTSTTVSSKLMVSDTSTATASIKVKALVDGVEAAPGQVVYGKRTQQLSATLEGAIIAGVSNCLSIITNGAGGLQIVLNTNCVQPEIISLLDDSVSANSFIFAAPNLASGFHNIEIQARIDALGDNQNGSFTATAFLGKGTMTAESVRVAKDPVYPYILPME